MTGSPEQFGANPTESESVISNTENKDVEPNSEISPEVIAKTEEQELKEIDERSDAEYSEFNTDQEKSVEGIIATGKDLSFPESEINARLDSSGTKAALDGLKSKAESAYKGFKKILAVGVGAVSITAGQEARPITFEQSPIMAQVQKVETLSKTQNQQPETETLGTRETDDSKQYSIQKDNPQREYLKSQEAYLEKVTAEENKARESRVESIRFALQQAEQDRQKAREAGDSKEELEAVRELVQFQKFLEKEQKTLTPQDFEKFDARTREKAKADLERIPDEAADAYKKYDDQREWLADVVHSSAYEAKAMGKEGLSPDDLERRKRDSLRDEINLDDQYNPVSSGNVGTFNPSQNRQRSIRLNYGQIPQKESILNQDKEKYQDLPLAVHEMEHSTTYGDVWMSEKAKKLYQDSYIKIGGSSDLDSYLSQPTELDARKRVFEYELEQNGVWKYGETFTEEHLEKAIELNKAGKLSADSNDFLNRLKHDKIPEIMNTIAENKKDGKNFEEA